MDIIYKKADISDIDNLVDLKIKQNLFFDNRDGVIMKNEDIVRENIKKVLLQELGKTMYFFISIDKDNNRAVACSGVIVHQMIPSDSTINGKKAYITSVYTDEDYRRNGIQDVLMQMVLDLLEEIECKKIELDASNPPAIKLYEKFGFKKHNIKYILEK